MLTDWGNSLPAAVGWVASEYLLLSEALTSELLVLLSLKHAYYVGYLPCSSHWAEPTFGVAPLDSKPLNRFSSISLLSTLMPLDMHNAFNIVLVTINLPSFCF